MTVETTKKEGITIKQVRRKHSIADVKILYAKSANRCMMPTCRRELILKANAKSNSAQMGKIAHIVGHSDHGPRGDKNYSRDKLDREENWILLCPTCHEKIDTQEATYSVDDLVAMKNAHVEWVDLKLIDEKMPLVHFAELDIAAKAIASGAHYSPPTFLTIAPEDKIKKNGLSLKIHRLIASGLSATHEVESYLIKMAQIDPDFPDRLNQGFKDNYLVLKKEKSGDELFRAMHEFSYSKHKDTLVQAAGLAILVHIFHLCEIFER